MKYTECKWHHGCERPIKSGHYIVRTKNGCSFTSSYNINSAWGHNEVEYWSEIPSEPTDEELDEEAYNTFALKRGEHWLCPECRKVFLEGCKSARERIKK